MNEAIANSIDQLELFQKNSTEYYDYLFRHVLRLTRDRTDAEEITQTVFMKFLKLLNGKDKKEIRSVKAYLARTATNLCKDMWSRRRKEMSVSYEDEHVREKLEREAVESDDSVARLENGIYYKERYRSLPLNTIFSGLTEYEIEILYLRRVDEISIKEIALIVGKEVSAVRYDLQKLEARIRHRVRKLTTEPR